MSGGIRALLIGISLAAVVLVSLPVFRSVAAWVDRQQRFPVLFDANFSDVLKMTESMTADSDVDIEVRNNAVWTNLLAGPMPGIVVRGFMPDWRGYRELVVDAENTDALPLVLEIHVRDRGGSDERSDRFNSIRELPVGRRIPLRFNLSEIGASPRNRKMLMDDMMIIAIYRVAPGKGSFAIHSISLE